MRLLRGGLGLDVLGVALLLSVPRRPAVPRGLRVLEGLGGRSLLVNLASIPGEGLALAASPVVGPIVRALRPRRGLLVILDVSGGRLALFAIRVGVSGGSLALLAVRVVVGRSGLALLAVLVEVSGGRLALLVLDISVGLVLLVVLASRTGRGLGAGGRRSGTSRGSNDGRGGGWGSLGGGGGRSTGLELVVELASVDLAHVVPLPGIDLIHLLPVALLESIEGQVTSVEGFDVALDEGEFLRCINEVLREKHVLKQCPVVIRMGNTYERGGEDTSTLEGEHSGQNKASGNTHVDLNESGGGRWEKAMKRDLASAPIVAIDVRDEKLFI